MNTARLASRTGGIWLDIIGTDREFDALVSFCMGLGMGIVIDPQIDMIGKVIKFTPVVAMPIDDETRNSLFEFGGKKLAGKKKRQKKA